MGFAEDIKKFSQKAEKSMDRVVLELVVDLNRLVVKRTPIDTGNARGGWTASIGAPMFIGSSGPDDKSGARTINKLSRVAKDAPGKIYYLTNSVEYIRNLEYGHSKIQAPQGMVRLSIKEVKQKVDDYVRGI